MDFDIRIKKIGKINNIFAFYRAMIEQNDIKTHMFLESIDPMSNNLLYSFIAVEPDLVIKIKNENLSLVNINSERGEIFREEFESLRSWKSERNNLNKKVYNIENMHDSFFEDHISYSMPALDLLNNIFPVTKSAFPDLFPRNVFSGGLLGYIGYDIVAPWVKYKPKTQEDFPDILMGCFTNVYIYSHLSKSLYFVDNIISGSRPRDLLFHKFVDDRVYDQFDKNIPDNRQGNKLLIDDINSIKNEIKKNRAKYLERFRPNISPSKWADIINKTKEYIFNGDIIQAVLSRKLRIDSEVSPIDVYTALRITNPSPYMYFLSFDDFGGENIHIIGSSPEPLITMNRDHLSTIPIAGTRRRGRNPDDELKMRNDLINDVKERAEHIMLVDLARNDLAKVSVPGTTQVSELMKVKLFPHVMHLVSKVESKTKKDCFNVLKSVFPAGTVSGAPKLRAMQIIKELEPENRGPYAGVVGYISFYGDMDLAIAIRTIFNKKNTYIAQAGAGIVADSDPRLEYIETDNKMQGILDAVILAESLKLKK